MVPVKIKVPQADAIVTRDARGSARQGAC